MILFDIFPTVGHYEASIPLARQMRKMGFSIRFIGSSEFETRIIEEEGIDFSVVRPLVVPNESHLLYSYGWLGLIREMIGSYLRKSRQQTVDSVFRQYAELFETYRPQLVVLDEHYAIKELLYLSFGIPVLLIQTMVSPRYDQQVPPFQSYLDPAIASLEKINSSWQKTLRNNRWRERLMDFCCLGQSTKQLLLNKSDKIHLDTNRCLHMTLKGSDSLVLVPKSFDFPRARYDHIYHTYFTRTSNIANIDAEMASMLDRLQSLTEKTRIYFSLGTMTSLQLTVAQRLYELVLKLCVKRDDLEVILSVGNFSNISYFKNKLPNLHVYHHVPQLEVLKHMDVMITHGGMNSILECIQHGVPMIALPLTKEWDQRGNAVRIEYHNLGVFHKIKDLSAQNLESTIDSVVTNKEFFVASLKMKHEEFLQEEYHQEEYLATLVQKIISKKNINSNV